MTSPDNVILKLLTTLKTNNRDNNYPEHANTSNFVDVSPVDLQIFSFLKVKRNNIIIHV